MWGEVLLNTCITLVFLNYCHCQQSWTLGIRSMWTETWEVRNCRGIKCQKAEWILNALCRHQGCSFTVFHKIIKYPVLEEAHKNHWSPTPGSTQDTPKLTPCAQEHWPNTSYTLSGWCCDLFPGEDCSSAQPPSVWRTFPDIQPKSCLAQLQGIPSGPVTGCSIFIVLPFTRPCFQWPYTSLFCVISKRRFLLSQAGFLPPLLDLR